MIPTCLFGSEIKKLLMNSERKFTSYFTGLRIYIHDVSSVYNLGILFLYNKQYRLSTHFIPFTFTLF